MRRRHAPVPDWPPYVPPGSEDVQVFLTAQGDERVQYDYRHTNGRLYTTFAPDLETARARRDAWLEQFIATVEGGAR